MPEVAEDVRGSPGEPTAPECLIAVSAVVDELLAEFLDGRVQALAVMHPALEAIGRAIADFVGAGGKRLRPAFVYWGHRATGADHDAAVYSAAAAYELLHTFALIHDDVMDRSAERRGHPTVHEVMATTHAVEGLVGDASWFGIGGAILAGDLAFVWADQLFDTTAVSPTLLERARAVFTELRVEVMAGQYLDLRLSGMADADEFESRRVALLKSGRYTVTRPLQLGAALGGGDERLDSALRAYGDATGLAFQLRDDVLGLFGDPTTTGKGHLDDLREGKRTVLILKALELSKGAGRQVLEQALGRRDIDEQTANRARQVVVECGALESVERLLVRQAQTAYSAVKTVQTPARQALEELADLAVSRVL